MTKTKRQLRAEAVERLNDMVLETGSAVKKLAIALDVKWNPDNSPASMSKLQNRIADLLTDDDTHESREGYEERMYDVPVSDCPYCGCDRVVIHDYNDLYERPHSYRVEHVDEKEAFNCDCFESYYGFDSIEKAVKHADMREGERNEHPKQMYVSGEDFEWLQEQLDGEPINGISDETNGIHGEITLPEDDAVAILRKAAKCTSVNTSVGDVLRYNVPGNEPSAWQTAEDACEALADMVERDYVLREVFEDLRDEFTWETTFLHRMGKKCGTKDVPSLVAYVDKLEARVEELEAVDRRIAETDSRWEAATRDLERMTAERDEWRAKFTAAIGAIEEPSGWRDENRELYLKVDRLEAERDEWKAKAEAKSAKRAAAVERLRNFESSDEGDGYYWDVTCALLGKRPTEYDNSDELLSALIDLLTDDDAISENLGLSQDSEILSQDSEIDTREKLQEGDAVALLRDWLDYKINRFDAEANAIILNTGADPGKLYEIADMVERDYMRREECEGLEHANKRQARKIHDVCEANSKLKAERDELEKQLDTMRDVAREFRDERDEWKAKAEGQSKDRAGQSNIEWLLEHDRDAVKNMLRCFLDGDTSFTCDDCAYDKYRVDGKCQNWSKWLMAPHSDSHSDSESDQREQESESESVYQSEFTNCGNPYREGSAVLDSGVIRPIRTIADMSAKSADCARNDGLMSENDVSAIDVDANDANATQDSREELEADALALVDNLRMYGGKYAGDAEVEIIGMLDRQAAIDRKEFQTILEEIQKCVRNGSR